MRVTALLLLTLFGFTIICMTQLKHAPAEGTAMTAGDLQQIAVADQERMLPEVRQAER